MNFASPRCQITSAVCSLMPAPLVGCCRHRHRRVDGDGAATLIMAAASGRWRPLTRSARRGELLHPVDPGWSNASGCKGHAELGKARVHDVLAVAGAGEPAPHRFLRGLGSGSEILPDDTVVVDGRSDALRRRAAIVTGMLEVLVAQHILGVRLRRPHEQLAGFSRCYPWVRGASTAPRPPA